MSVTAPDAIRPTPEAEGNTVSVREDQIEVRHGNDSW